MIQVLHYFLPKVKELNFLVWRNIFLWYMDHRDIIDIDTLHGWVFFFRLIVFLLIH